MQITEAIDTLSGVSQNEQKKVDAIKLAASILQNTFQPQLTELDSVKQTLATQQTRAEIAEADASQQKTVVEQAQIVVEQKTAEIESLNVQVTDLVAEKEILNTQLVKKTNEINSTKQTLSEVTGLMTSIVESPDVKIEDVKVQLATKVKEIASVSTVTNETIIP